jgi:hypothetical protein
MAEQDPTKKAEAPKAAGQSEAVSKAVPETRRAGWIVMTHPELQDKDGQPVYHEVPQKAVASRSRKGWVKAEAPQKVSA